MVKKIVALMALMLCISVAVVTLSGCAKKKEQPVPEQAAPADSTVAPVDTTAVQ